MSTNTAARPRISPIERAIIAFGSQDRLAAAIGVSQAAITKAKISGKVSPALAIAISKATGGVIGLKDLAPELYAAVLAEMQVAPQREAVAGAVPAGLLGGTDALRHSAP